VEDGGAALRLPGEDAIERYHVEVHVALERRVEPLDKGDSARLAALDAPPHGLLLLPARDLFYEDAPGPGAAIIFRTWGSPEGSRTR
jgi:hypothetical protein